MASRYLLLLLPTLICARMEIAMVASSQGQDVHASGYSTDLISDVERSTFGINDKQLKQAVEDYFGKRPTDVFVRSPTPWGDLYKTYGWSQVTTTLRPQNAKVLAVTSNPTVIMTQVFRNNSTMNAEFSAQINQDVQTSYSSTWDKGGEITIGQEISYDFFTLSGTTSFSYTGRWGESQTRSETVTVGSKSGVKIVLDPEQSVIAELYATRGTMRVQVDYEATLSGSVAVNYEKPYKGHHFWALGVNSVMQSGGLDRVAKSREIITLDYYTDSHVEIRDAKNNSVLYSIPVDMY